MGINSTEVSYGFGQMGSTFLSGDGSYLDLDNSDALYYVTAITFISDTKFGGNGLKVLNAGEGAGFPDTHFISSEDDASVGTLDTDWGADTNETDNDAKPIVLDGGGTTFPAGITIYGMWDYVELHSGSCIAYVAPRPDYRDRA